MCCFNGCGHLCMKVQKQKPLLYRPKAEPAKSPKSPSSCSCGKGGGKCTCGNCGSSKGHKASCKCKNHHAYVPPASESDDPYPSEPEEHVDPYPPEPEEEVKPAVKVDGMHSDKKCLAKCGASQKCANVGVLGAPGVVRPTCVDRRKFPRTV